MCIYVHIFMYECVHMCIYVSNYVSVCMHMCTYIVLCTYLSICMQMSVCTNKHMHVYTWVCIVCACICAFMCEHLCMYSVYICAYTCVCVHLCVKDKDDFVHVNYLSLLSKVKSGSTSRSQSAWRPHNSLTLVKEDSLISSFFVFMISLSFSLCFWKIDIHIHLKNNWEQIYILFPD